MTLQLGLLALGGLVIAALGYWMRREQAAQDKYKLEELNRKAAERVAKAAQDAPHSRSDIVDRLRHGGG